MTSELLRELLAVTPMPPTGDADAIIAAFEAMFEARQQILVRITDKLPDTDENRAVLRELWVRDEAWEHALGAARDAVGVARSGTKQLRGYAR
ncbi:MAG: hypothetical protein AB7T06_22590 [Kofleriaceae bacterium]